jgi:hypothetical protein
MFINPSDLRQDSVSKQSDRLGAAAGTGARQQGGREWHKAQKQ